MKHRLRKLTGSGTAVFAVVLAACTLINCGNAGANKSPYNKGVAAWRAKDFAEARRQWELSLAQGGSNAAFNNLGYLLYYGEGGPMDRTRAVALWLKGAALAVSEAQFHLGTAYEEGGGITASRTQAYAWYKCAIATAARLSTDSAIERSIQSDAEVAIAKLGPLLTADERTEGERLAQDYISKYSVPLPASEPQTLVSPRRNAEAQ